MIHAMLQNASLSLKDMDYLAVANGPGSFTGIRIGVAAVKGLAFADDLPCVGVSTLGAMARLVEGLPFDGIVCAAMDARCQQVYTACFVCEQGALTRLTDDEALPLAVLREQLKKFHRPILFVGDGAELCYNTMKDDDMAVCLAPPQCRYQHAAGVAMEAAAQADHAVPAEALMPVYLRLPQAERELRQRLEQSH